MHDCLQRPGASILHPFSRWIFVSPLSSGKTFREVTACAQRLTTSSQVWSKSESRAFNYLILGIARSMNVVPPTSRCLINHQVAPAMRNDQQGLSDAFWLSTLLCWPQLEAAVLLPCPLSYTLISPVLSIFPHFFLSKGSVVQSQLPWRVRCDHSG